jgi:murein L,D-transpeptidase YcbB/YkuD
MPEKSNLPSDQQYHRQSEKTDGIILFHKKQRRKHHGIIPVINPASTAALVLQKPGLKRTKEQDTDQIANRVKTGQQYHDPVI